MESDKELIRTLRETIANLQANNQALTRSVDRLQEEIVALNKMRRVKSIKYENKIIKYITRENKATLAEIAELLGLKAGNASRVINRMLVDGRLIRSRRGVYKLKKVE